MAHVPRSKAELERLLALAKQLVFADDIAHWQNELKKLEGTT